MSEIKQLFRLDDNILKSRVECTFFPLCGKKAMWKKLVKRPNDFPNQSFLCEDHALSYVAINNNQVVVKYDTK